MNDYKVFVDGKIGRNLLDGKVFVGWKSRSKTIKHCIFYNGNLSQ